MAVPSDRSDLLGPAGTRRAALSGLCASLVGIGLARFAYTPLIPALISNQWFSQSEAAYLGAANLAGYLAGALFGRALLRWASAAWVLRAMMLLTALSLLACESRDLGLAWFFFWRLVSGYTGGAIMVLAAPTVLARTPPARRGLVGGAVFTGVGLGVVASGSLVPLLLAHGGLAGTWIGLGALALLLTLIGWRGWPSEPKAQPAMPHDVPAKALGLPLASLLVEYGLNAVGLVPHMLFLVVYVAHGLGRGLETGAGYWVLFGIGATLGPVLAGRLADRTGFRRALRCAFVAQAIAVALPAFLAGPAWLTVSSLVVGAFTPGIVPLVLGRIHELVAGHAAQRRAWGHATTAFALTQALAAYGFSYLLARTGSYALLFGLGALAVVAAFALDAVAAVASRALRRGAARPRAAA